MAFYSKKKIPIESLDTTAICVFRFFKEVKKKTQHLCVFLLERTLKLDQLFKKKFHGRNSREWYFPGAPITCRDGARTQSSKSHKIMTHSHNYQWKYNSQIEIANTPMHLLESSENIFFKRISIFNSLESQIWVSDWQSNQGMRWSQQTNWPK